jgi:Protein of unknown function (DUF2971)
VKLIENITSQKPARMIYHYASATGLIGILDKKTLWATNHLHLNDRQELKIATHVFREEARASTLNEEQRAVFLKVIQKLEAPSFIVSLSEHGDLLSQWRAYCPGGDGYALGFSPENPIFESAREKSFNLIRCVYKTEEQRKLCKILLSEFADFFASFKPQRDRDLSEQIRTLFKGYEFKFSLAALNASFKQKGFSEEGEWRLVSQYPERLVSDLGYRTGRFGITPYYPLPLSQGSRKPHIDHLVIGPSSNRKAAKEAINFALKTYGFEGTKVSMSNTPLRK